MPWEGASYVEKLLQAVPPKYVAAASLTTLVYDNLITLDQEISTVWRASWSTGKILFLLNRYVALIVSSVAFVAQTHPNPSINFCHPWYYIESFASIFGLVVVQIILMLRTYALYKRSRVILFSLFALCAVCSGSMTILAGLFSVRVFYHENPLPELVGPNIIGMGCLKDCRGCLGLLQAFYVPMLVFDGTVFILTFISAVQYSRENIHIAFLTMLYRDGFLYFTGSLSITCKRPVHLIDFCLSFLDVLEILGETVIFATSLSNLIIWTVVIGPGVEILLPLIRAMLSVMCSRLMLNIRVTITRHAPTTGQGNEEIDLSDECDRALDIQLERFEAQARGEDMSKKRGKGLRRMWANKRPSGDVHPGFAMVPEDMSVPPSPLSPLSPTPGTGMSDRAISIIPLLSQYSHRSRQLSGNLAEIALQQESSGSSPTTSAYPPSETNSHYKPQPFETMQESSRSTSLSRRILPLHKQSRDLTTPVSASAHTSSSPSRSRRPASAGNQGYRGYGDVHVPMVNLSRSQTLPAQSRPRYVDEEAGESDTVLDETNDAEEEIEVEVEFDRPGYEGGARTSGESSTEEERDRRLREWQEEWEWNWRDKWRPSFSASRRPSR